MIPKNMNDRGGERGESVQTDDALGQGTAGQTTSYLARVRDMVKEVGPQGDGKNVKLLLSLLKLLKAFDGKTGDIECACAFAHGLLWEIGQRGRVPSFAHFSRAIVFVSKLLDEDVGSAVGPQRIVGVGKVLLYTSAVKSVDLETMVMEVSEPMEDVKELAKGIMHVCDAHPDELVYLLCERPQDAALLTDPVLLDSARRCCRETFAADV